MTTELTCRFPRILPHSYLLRGVAQRPRVLDDELRHGLLLLERHLGRNHQFRLSLRELPLLHQPLQLQVLLARDHDDFVHVVDHCPCDDKGKFKQCARVSIKAGTLSQC